MKKNIFFAFGLALLLSGCAGEFNKVYKSQDYDYRYEYAKQCFAEGKYQRAVTLLQDLITMKTTLAAHKVAVPVTTSLLTGMLYITTSPRNRLTIFARKWSASPGSMRTSK